MVEKLARRMNRDVEKFDEDSVDKVPFETKGALQQPPVIVSNKLIMNWSGVEGHSNRGIFYNREEGGAYSVVVGYVREGKNLVIDTVRFRDVEESAEVEVLRKSNVIEGIIKFCDMNKLEIESTIPLMTKIAREYDKVIYKEGFVDVVPLAAGSENMGIKIELRRSPEL